MQQKIHDLAWGNVFNFSIHCKHSVKIQRFMFVTLHPITLRNITCLFRVKNKKLKTNLSQKRVYKCTTLQFILFVYVRLTAQHCGPYKNGFGFHIFRTIMLQLQTCTFSIMLFDFVLSVSTTITAALCQPHPAGTTIPGQLI